MDFIELFKEPIFWIVSAIGSVLLSIFSNLITPYVGRMISKVFSSRKSKLEKKKHDLIVEVRYVASDQNRILNYKVDAAYWLLRGVMLLVMGTLVFSVSGYLPIFELVPLVAAAIFMARSTQWLNIAKNKYKVAKLAMERIEIERKIEKETPKTRSILEPVNLKQEKISKWELDNIF